MSNCGVNNAEIREKLLQNADIALKKAIELFSVIEMLKSRYEIMSKTTQNTSEYGEVIVKTVRAFTLKEIRGDPTQRQQITKVK